MAERRSSNAHASLVEVLKAIRAVVTPGFPSDSSPLAMEAEGLPRTSRGRQQCSKSENGLPVDAGADAFHLSQPAYWQPAFPEADANLNTGRLGEKVHGRHATITVGSVGLGSDVYDSFAGKDAQSAPLDDLLARLERGEFDLVAVGRALLQDAAWLEKIRQGRIDGWGTSPRTLSRPLA